MMNDPAGPLQDPLKKPNVVYRYLCPVRGCLDSYIGMAKMRFSKRVSCHAQEGAIFNHAKTAHNQKIKRRDIIPNIDIIAQASDHRRLRRLEALHTGKRTPSLNITEETFLLPIATRRPTTSDQHKATIDQDSSSNGSAYQNSLAPSQRCSARMQNRPSTHEMQLRTRWNVRRPPMIIQRRI